MFEHRGGGGDGPGSIASVAMDHYAAGDREAFWALYDAIAPRLYAYFLKRTGDIASAEDLVQQTFLQIHDARGTFLRGADVMPWVFAIARRLFVDAIRRSKRELPLATTDEAEIDLQLGGEAAADDLVAARELASVVEREIARLPDAQRTAFEMIKEQGMSIARAAEALGTTVPAVKLRAHRAYEAIHHAIDLASRPRRMR